MSLTWPNATHIYLSPHLDDAVLSCGGSIFDQAHRGETIAVITLFAASPPADHQLSPYAQLLHQRWQASAPPGIDFSNPTAVRREEDIRALAVLSPSIQVIHHRLLDCIYRVEPLTGETLYASEEAIFGDVQPADPALADLQVAPLLPEKATLYLPLAIGNHVDHQVVRSAVEKWEIPRHQLRYYEDYPYVAYPGALEATLGDPSRWEAIPHALSEKTLAAKIRAAAEHISQLSTFWESEAAMSAAVREQAQRSGGERLWVRKG
jgi:LmbE family N-acetylglucosaminyl deacetylase